MYTKVMEMFKRLRRIERFNQVGSPITILLISISVIGFMQIIMGLTWKQLGLLYIADTLTIVILLTPLSNFFVPRYLGAKFFYPKVDHAKIKDLDLEGKRELFQNLLRFPRRFSLFSILASFLKAAVLIVMICTLWLPTEQFARNALTVFMIELLVLMSFYGMVYSEYHSLASRIIDECHKKHDWTDVLTAFQTTHTRRDFDLPNNISISATWFSAMILIWAVITNPSHSSDFETGLKVCFVFLISIAFVSWTFFQSREFFLEGLEDVINQYALLNENERRIIALHTSPLLSRFEETFNKLTTQLRANEQELSFWILQQNERNRYRTLGEISGLVIHDLSGPLHVIRYCAQELKGKVTDETARKYLHRIEVSNQRTLELIDALKSQIRRPDSNKEGTEPLGAKVGACHANVLQVLGLELYQYDLSMVTISLAKELGETELFVSHPELSHVLSNLYKNSLTNMFQNMVKDPKLSIQLARHDSQKNIFEIHILDNGTGLTPERFEELTGRRFFGKSEAQKFEGLGLKLVRRLVERNQGTLDVISKLLPGEQSGTCFVLKLKGITRQHLSENLTGTQPGLRLNS